MDFLERRTPKISPASEKKNKMVSCTLSNEELLFSRSNIHHENGEYKRIVVCAHNKYPSAIETTWLSPRHCVLTERSRTQRVDATRSVQSVLETRWLCSTATRVAVATRPPRPHPGQGRLSTREQDGGCCLQGKRYGQVKWVCTFVKTHGNAHSAQTDLTVQKLHLKADLKCLTKEMN